MDLSKTIAELYEERIRLDKVIFSLEQLKNDSISMPTPTPRRGRKFMSPQERREVSARMRRYWAERRATEQMNEARALTAASAA